MMGPATASRTGPGLADHERDAAARPSAASGRPAARPEGAARGARHRTTASAAAHPSIPQLLIRMALIGRLYAIHSERRLCEEVRYNLAYRWFCGLAPGAAVPHHSTFSKNRHGRFRDAGVFRALFEATVRQCITAGLVTAKDAAIDASFVAADAELSAQDARRRLRTRRVSRIAVREWLADQACAPPQEQGRRRGRPVEVSRTDPASAWSARTVRGRFGYALNVLVDTPAGVAIDVEASPARFASEVDAGRAMLCAPRERFGLPAQAGRRRHRLWQCGLSGLRPGPRSLPHIPVLERSGADQGHVPAGGVHVRPPEGPLHLPRRQDPRPQGLRPADRRAHLLRASGRLPSLPAA